MSCSILGVELDLITALAYVQLESKFSIMLITEDLIGSSEIPNDVSFDCFYAAIELFYSVHNQRNRTICYIIIRLNAILTL